MIPLEPLKLPLKGLALIEASAGTGKTYTIATLFLRFLLEARHDVDQILVVTFTQAATEELRDRIRRRIVQSLELLSEVDGEGVEADSELRGMLEAMPDSREATGLLADALARMDEAPIYTIHGFCQRMLLDNAFESGMAFDVEFITDEARMLARAGADFWRNRVARADPDRAQWVRNRWKTPLALLKALQPTLALDDVRVLPRGDAADVGLIRQRLDELFLQLKSLWRAESAGIIELLQKSPGLKRTSYTKPVVAKALRAAEQVASGDGLPPSLPAGFERLTAAMLAEKGTKPGAVPLTHPFFDLCESLQTLLGGLDVAEQAGFLTDARNHIREGLDRHKRDESLLYFDDLLRRLDQALAGEGGDALADLMVQRFPVAMIDEFQDTDPQQFRIFQKVYIDQPDGGLFLIGDPKQAVYAFRGADIFTYMQARDLSDRVGNQYTLGINWRSGSRLIEAINQLFSSSENPFIYAPHIRFHPVSSAPGSDDAPLRVDGEEPVPLQFWMLQLSEDNQTRRPRGFIRKDAALVEAAGACAEHIAGLLNRGESKQAMLGDRSLLPEDIALLVRTHSEGHRVQDALAACGIPSVTLSRESVFDSEDADELTSILIALESLNDERRVRAALATGLLGFDAVELERLARDDTAWERVLARFQSYRDLWQGKGAMIALQSMMDTEGIGQRLLSRPDGERRMTNFLQLIELLQVASRDYPGIDGLLRWFVDQPMGGVLDDVQQLRLDSDQGLVKIVTMHKSKGLEYPLVFIPFPWSYFDSSRDTPPLFHDEAEKRACVDFGSPDISRHRELEQIEQLAERLRLFYVSVTRAVRLCVICWGKINRSDHSALAYLLHRNVDDGIPGSGMSGLSEQALWSDLQSLADRVPSCISVKALPSLTGEYWGGGSGKQRELSAAIFTARIDSTWRVSSYSNLVRGGESEHPDYDRLIELDSGDGSEIAGGGSVFELPAGTQTGHFLHELFENLDFPHAGGDSLESSVKSLLERYGQLQSGRTGSTDAVIWGPVVIELVKNVLDTPLDSDGELYLRNIPIKDRLVEMEFHFALSGLDAHGLLEALSSAPDYAGSASGLAFEPMHGLMRGFIDLVFRYRGRFYILDYKSNLLGKQLSAYGETGMKRAIREHRYDLQYLIYTVALHRFLDGRLPDYDYEHHFGGVYYLFLRGMRPSLGRQSGIWYDRPKLELIDRLNRCFGTGKGVT
ncbi:MAG: exodeoxyribonuclease V subunit beta [Gammaproteobacteria bacterium]|nr:exodeoxyribonuclease V subunit beta [Gammaproteobacteria bacterium]